MSVDASVQVLGETSRILPQGNIDGAESGAARFGRYNEQVVQNLTPTKHLLADEGSYFVVTNPTPGTGIALNAVVTAFSDTNALFVIKNTEPPSSALSKRIYLDYLRLMLFGTPPTAQVSIQFAFKRSPSTNREPTTAANRTVLTPVNQANGSGRGSVASVLSWAAAGGMTIPASSLSDPVVGRCSLPTGIGIAGDEYVIKFGADVPDGYQALTAAKAAVPGRYVTNAPPIIVEPGEWLVIHRWCLTEATNAPTYEFELGFWER